MSKLYIKPAPGLLVLDPLTRKPLENGGEPKPADTYWMRRLADGDVIEIPGAEPARKPASKKPQGAAE